MRRSAYVLAISLLLVLAFAGQCFASVNIPDRRTCPEVFPEYNCAVPVKLHQGWFKNKLVWFTCTESNSLEGIRFFCTPFCPIDRPSNTESNSIKKLPFGITFAPRLTAALGVATNPVYVVRNFQQGPIFTSVPTKGDYTPLLQVFFITWKDPSMARPITSAHDLPPADQIIIEETDIVMNCPVLAVGPLDGPWYPIPDNNDIYRLPQVLKYFPREKIALLPSYFVFCKDPITEQPSMSEAIIPDVSDPALAELLGANLAPKLAAVPDEATQRFWVQRGPKPPGQFPVIKYCSPCFADFFFCPRLRISNINREFLNGNRIRVTEYTPIMNYTLLHRTGLPQYVTVNNPDFLKMLIKSGALTVAGEGTIINAPVVPCFFFDNFNDVKGR